MRGKLIGVSGALITVCGAVAPFVRVPILGSSTILDKSPIAGSVLILCAGAGGYFFSKGRLGFASVASYLAFAISVLSILGYFDMLASLQSTLDRFFLGWLGHIFIGKVSLSWGAFLLVGGSFMMVRGAKVLRREQRSQALQPQGSTVKADGSVPVTEPPTIGAASASNELS